MARTKAPTGRDLEVEKYLTLEECCEAIMSNHFGWGQFKQWYIEKTSLSWRSYRQVVIMTDLINLAASTLNASST